MECWVTTYRKQIWIEFNRIRNSPSPILKVLRKDVGVLLLKLKVFINICYRLELKKLFWLCIWEKPGHKRCYKSTRGKVSGKNLEHKTATYKTWDKGTVSRIRIPENLLEDCRECIILTFGGMFRKIPGVRQKIPENLNFDFFLEILLVS